MKKKIAFSLRDIPIYFILIPFLRPNGFNSYSSFYNQFFTMWLYLAVMIIFIYSARTFYGHKIKFKRCIIFMIVYYIVMIIITFVNLGNGLQKMFAAPALFLACYIFLKKDIRQFVNCIANLFLIEMALNVTVFSSVVIGKYFNPSTNHLMFLGHIQMGAQIGIVGIFISYVLYQIAPLMKIKSALLALLCILNMIYCATDAAIISITLFSVCLLIAFLTKRSKAYKLDSRLVFAAFIALDMVFLIMFLPNRHWTFALWSFSLNGRGEIWRLMMNTIKESIVWGYGVQGITIITPWAKHSEGLNYAHNESLQVLLDGGIVLAISYVCMFISYIKNLNYLKNYKLIVVSKSCLIVFLILMIFESTSMYYYWCIFLSLISFLPEVEEQMHQGGQVYGIYN